MVLSKMMLNWFGTDNQTTFISDKRVVLRPARALGVAVQTSACLIALLRAAVTTNR